jgi:hypothetical protein
LPSLIADFVEHVSALDVDLMRVRSESKPDEQQAAPEDR